MAIIPHFEVDKANNDEAVEEDALDIKRLLDHTTTTALDDSWPAGGNTAQSHAFANAPLFSMASQSIVEKLARRGSSGSRLVPQYGLIGSQDVADGRGLAPEDQLIMANLNIPWSAFICGSQGSGKSHTLSCLLEACLIQDNPTAKLSHPMSAMVFHFDSFTSGSATQICEAAYLASSGVPVRVLVPPSNIWSMDRAYSRLAGMTQDCPNLQVVPLYLDDSKLNASTLLKLMAFDPSGSVTPLYMEVVMRIIREITMEGIPFTYSLFRSRLAKTKLLPGQEMPLQMRIQLLESFLVPELTPHMTKPSAAGQDIWDFQPGSLTIVDLSDPFLSSDDACGLFSICLSIFLQGRTSCSRVVALDEAHKFLTQSGAASVLTEDLTSVIRQQRHISTRVFTSTQEPTLSPKLIDLSNATFVHRFSSPAWFDALKGHLAGISQSSSSGSEQHGQSEIFRSMTELRTGEALVFCPTAQIRATEKESGQQNQSLGFQHMRLRIRKRITLDGGASLVATAEVPSRPSTQQTDDGRIKMHSPVAKVTSNKKSKSSNANTQSTANHGGRVLPAISAQLSSVATSPVVVTPVAKTKIQNQAELISFAFKYARKLAQDKSWNHTTAPVKAERNRYLEEFRARIEGAPQACSAAATKMMFFNAIGTVLGEFKHLKK